jgi:hypothetical protein
MALFGAAFLFANFLGVLRRCASCLGGDFLPSLFFDLVDFFAPNPQVLQWFGFELPSVVPNVPRIAEKAGAQKAA